MSRFWFQSVNLQSAGFFNYFSHCVFDAMEFGYFHLFDVTFRKMSSVIISQVVLDV